MQILAKFPKLGFLKGKEFVYPRIENHKKAVSEIQTAIYQLKTNLRLEVQL